MRGAINDRARSKLATVEGENRLSVEFSTPTSESAGVFCQQRKRGDDFGKKDFVKR